ncbi:MAG: MHYT domain-containing protein [Ghiorsea sp.]|nr:MHYT domain-containing protein [Ghiorsea sp.]
MQVEILGNYNPILVTLSVVVAILSSFVALSTMSRITKSNSKQQKYIWTFLFGMSFGTGVWGMHFIGMLAFQLPIPVLYGLGLTAISLAIAIASAWLAGLFIKASKKMRGIRLVLLALMLGISIASMHYIGMAAMLLDATMKHHLPTIVGSIFVAIVASGIGLYIIDGVKNSDVFDEFRYKIIVSILMGAAISAMHYIAMSGVSFTASTLIHPPFEGLGTELLGIFLLSIIFLFECGVLITSLMDEKIAIVSSKLKAEAYAKRLATVIEQAGELIMVTDKEGIIEYVNPAFERVSGYTLEEVIGKRPSIVKSGEHSPTFYKNMWKKLDAGDSFHENFTNKSKDGALYEVAQRIFPMYDEHHRVNGYASVQWDITLQKKIEKKLHHADRIDSLGILAGGIAHDFNNILTAILGNASLATKKMDVNAPAFKHIARITQASHNAADLCRQMLAYSGKGKFVVESITISSVVQDMLKLVEVSTPKNIVLNYDLAEDMPLIDADRTQIQQVVLNLITNATESMEGKSGRITLATGVMHATNTYLLGSYGGANLEEGNYAFLEISDTGCGMDEEVQKKIFDPFFTTKFTGRGLGMSAMLGIVNGHQGALRIYSEVNKGTTFKLIFPISSQQQVVEKVDITSIEVSEAGGLVLVVDDEAIIRETACAMLEDMGFEVITANDGQHGLDMFTAYQDSIKFVLLDMTMPVMDGKECFRSLIALKKKCSGYTFFGL